MDIDGTSLNTVLFADDQIVIAKDNYDVEYKMRKNIKLYVKARMSVNKTKTKCMVVNGNAKRIRNRRRNY